MKKTNFLKIKYYNYISMSLKDRDENPEESVKWSESDWTGKTEYETGGRVSEDCFLQNKLYRTVWFFKLLAYTTLIKI